MWFIGHFHYHDIHEWTGDDGKTHRSHSVPSMFVLVITMMERIGRHSADSEDSIAGSGVRAGRSRKQGG